MDEIDNLIEHRGLEVDDDDDEVIDELYWLSPQPQYLDILYLLPEVYEVQHELTDDHDE